MSKAILVARCCDGRATLEELHALEERDREVTFATFARYVDIRAISECLGYAFGRERGLHLKHDRCVSYYRSMFRGQVCWHLDWSCIDHIFLTPEVFEKLQAA